MQEFGLGLWFYLSSSSSFPPFLCQNKEDTYFVVLHKEEGAGLGFSVAGGIDLEQKSVTVSDSSKCFVVVFLLLLVWSSLGVLLV